MTPYFEQNEALLDCHTIAIPLVTLAKNRGVHPDKVLKGTRLFYGDMVRQRQSISHEQLIRILANVQRHVKQDDTSFLLGRRMFPANLGLIGNALMNCRTIGQMLLLAKHYQMHLFPHCFVESKQQNGIHYLTFNPAISIDQEKQQIFLYELMASSIVSALKWRLQSCPEMTIRFPYAEPDYIEQYQVNLGCNVCFFPAAKNFGLQLSIADGLMNQPFVDSNNTLKRHYLSQLQKVPARVGLLQYILQFMAKHNEVTLEQVSEYLQISSATLKRKLSNHNTSFQMLYDQHRQQKAVFQLTNKGYTNEQVSKALNFSDTTNFRRSFKRWTGMTPNALKQMLSI